MRYDLGVDIERSMCNDMSMDDTTTTMTVEPVAVATGSALVTALVGDSTITHRNTYMTTSNDTITLDQLTPSQISALRKQMREQRKQDSSKRSSRNEIVDRMLQERDDDGFKWTTGDILAELVTAKLVSDDADRKEEIKKIQTRKQLLAKQKDDNGKPKYTVGYKASATGFGPLTIERVQAWLDRQTSQDVKTVSEHCAKILTLGKKGSKK